MKCWKKSAGRWWLRNRYHISSGTLSNWQIWPSLANSISNTCRCASYPADLIFESANMYLLIVFCSRFLFLLLSSLTEMSFTIMRSSISLSWKSSPLYFHVKILSHPLWQSQLILFFPSFYPYAGVSILSEYVCCIPRPLCRSADNVFCYPRPIQYFVLIECSNIKVSFIDS